MDLEGIMLSELSQRERQVPHYFTYMLNFLKKSKQMNKQNKNRLIETANTQMFAAWVRGDE